jgi:hypothetical protein
MSLKFRDKIDFTTFDNLMVKKDGNVVYALSCLASNLKSEVVQVLVFFISFIKKNMKRKVPSFFF